MNLDLVIRYLGFGDRCSNCGRVKETTRYTLREGETLLQQFRLCDDCQDKGYVVKFNVRNRYAMTKKVRKRRMKLSQRLEQGLAEDLGGTRTPGSGNQDTKADVRVVDEWRLEHKFTESMKGYRVLVEDLNTLIHNANLAGEWPALVLNFIRVKRAFAILPYEVFLELVEKIRGTTDNDR